MRDAELLRSRAMDGLILLRLLKFIGVAVFTAGVLGSVAIADHRQRRTAAQWVATAGLALVWIAGYGLLKHGGFSMAEPWISRGLLAGWLALGAAAWTASAPAVSPWSGSLSVGALVSAFGVMSARTGSPLFGLVIPAAAAALTFLWIRHARPHSAPDPNNANHSVRWFLWIGRAEGTSLLVLLGVYMPLKYLAKINLDGGQGWFGWVHGVLQLLFFVALVVAFRVGQWKWPRLPLGFMASVIPFGTFMFEAWIRRQDTAASATQRHDD